MRIFFLEVDQNSFKVLSVHKPKGSPILFLCSSVHSFIQQFHIMPITCQELYNSNLPKKTEGSSLWSFHYQSRMQTVNKIECSIWWWVFWRKERKTEAWTQRSTGSEYGGFKKMICETLLTKLHQVCSTAPQPTYSSLPFFPFRVPQNRSGRKGRGDGKKGSHLKDRGILAAFIFLVRIQR